MQEFKGYKLKRAGSAALILTGWFLHLAQAQVATFNVGPAEVGGCGRVSVNGVVLTNPGTNVSRLDWDWGDGDLASSFFPASHRYLKNGEYRITVTAFAGEAVLASRTTAVSIRNAEQEGCVDLISVQPFEITLQGGKTSEQLRAVRIRPDGQRAEMSLSEFRLRSLHASVATVTPDGVISGNGLGDTTIEALHVGTGNRMAIPVHVGRVRLEPGLARLHVMTNPTVQLRVIAENADGSSIDLKERTVRFRVNPADPAKQTVQLSESGLVTALRPPVDISELAYIDASVDGVAADNASLIRVVDLFEGLTFQDYSSDDAGRVKFEIASSIGDVDYAEVFRRYEVPRWTAVAREFEEEAGGFSLAVRGGVQYLVHDVGGGEASVPTIPCGLSGNPIRLGTDPSQPDRGCLVKPSNQGGPQWFIILHELGHSATLKSLKFREFAGSFPSASVNARFMEGLASTTAVYAGERMRENAEALGLQDPEALRALMTDAGIGHPYWQQVLEKYLASGADYAQQGDANVVSAIVENLMARYGVSWYFRLCSSFLPHNSGFDFAIRGETERSTFFVAVSSAAAGEGTDLREEFRQLGFPIDDAYYERILPYLKQAVEQREVPRG